MKKSLLIISLCVILAVAACGNSDDHQGQVLEIITSP